LDRVDPLRSDSIVGRRRELDALRAWLDTAREGVGRLVLCAGEPGIGKTRLAQELAGIALAGGTAVVWGRGVEAEGAPAFWPWRQVLRSLGLDAGTILAGDVESPEDRFGVFEDVTAAVRGAAERTGLVVILDDIHWADEPSLLVLRHLADQIAGARLIVLATFRHDEPASVLPRLLPDLLRSPAVENLDLRGFGLAEVSEQLSGTGGGDPAARRRRRPRPHGRQSVVRPRGRPGHRRRHLASRSAASHRARRGRCPPRPGQPRMPPVRPGGRHRRP